MSHTGYGSRRKTAVHGTHCRPPTAVHVSGGLRRGQDPASTPFPGTSVAGRYNTPGPCAVEVLMVQPNPRRRVRSLRSVPWSLPHGFLIPARLKDARIHYRRIDARIANCKLEIANSR